MIALSFVAAGALAAGVAVGCALAQPISRAQTPTVDIKSDLSWVFINGVFLLFSEVVGKCIQWVKSVQWDVVVFMGPL
jgi:hypothetical protein